MSAKDSDAAISDWEDEEVESEPEPAPQPVAAPKAKPKADPRTSPKAKPKADPRTSPKVNAAGSYTVPAHLQHPLDDPDAERQRQQLLAEHRDIALAGDMFGVSADEMDARSQMLLTAVQVASATHQAPKLDGNPLDHINVARMNDVEALCNALVPKIEMSQAKSATWLRMLDRLLAACSSKMEVQDLKTLSRKVNEAQKQRERDKNLQATKSKKGTDLKVNIKDPRGELEIFDGDEDDDNSDLDEYADFV